MTIIRDDNPHRNNDDSSCRPPSGTTYLTIGQDLFSIQEYVTSLYNKNLHEGSNSPLSSFTPAAVMVYTSLFSIENGTSLPFDYGSGIEYADGLLNDLFRDQHVGLQIGLMLEGSEGCDKINNGLVDDQIKLLAQYLESSTASRIFLRVGYEFDNPSFGFSDNPDSYVSAFRRIVTAVKLELSNSQRRHDVARVFFVWHSWAAPMSNKFTLMDFYPGDEYVDWIGVSIFQQVYSGSAIGTVEHVKGVLDFAYLHNKPTMIAESSPFGGFAKTDPWDNWYEKVLNIVNEYDISLWSYINCDWESQRERRGLGFGESRISANDEISNRWRKDVIGDTSRFLGAGSLLDCGGGIGDKISMRRGDWGLAMTTPVQGHGEWSTMRELVFCSTGMFVVAGLILAIAMKRMLMSRGRNNYTHYETMPIVTFKRSESMNIFDLNKGQKLLSRFREVYGSGSFYHTMLQ
eukprot:CAMPEP_0172523800 /NCGR_PEP_ID=MMETSP1066-20121228/293850_1 /TAXON_ID=671091 /ORGANISM="Coscinodiscus wailesii, Strain CCMP2513" /LENGTH=459 /DNA_ID=CAMNT_0013306891 /DNA_START=77 /DNA_END=1456 /DNA_ORIENTATION=-